jgi:hypothetical protein
MFALDARFLGLAEGASVSTWADRGGSGKQVTQTGTARPTLQGNWVSFDGANDEMLGSDSGFPTGDFFCSITAKANGSIADNTYDPILTYGSGSTGAAVLICYGTDVFFGTDAIGVSQYGDSIGIASSVGARLIYQLRRSSTSYLHSKNGGAETSKTMTTATVLGGTDRLAVGALGPIIPGQYLNGEIGAISLFASIPSESIRRRVAHSNALSFKLPFA